MIIQNRILIVSYIILRNVGITWYIIVYSLIYVNNQAMPYKHQAFNHNLVKQEWLTLPQHLSSSPVLCGLMLFNLQFSMLCFVDHCLSFNLFFPWSLYCINFHSRLLITILISLSLFSHVQHKYLSVKSPLGLVLYCYLNMPTINKTYLILSYTPCIYMVDIR